MSPTTQFASQRIVQGATAVLSAAFPDQNGESRVPGTVTVKIDRADGTSVLPAGTTTIVDGGGNPSVLVPWSATTQLDLLTCVWTEESGPQVTTLAEVVGGHYFTLFEARNLERSLQKNLDRQTDEDLLRVRAEVEVEVERITGRSFVPRFAVDASTSTDRGATRYLQLRETDIRAVRSVKIGGLAYDQQLWDLNGNSLYLGSGVGLLPQQIANGPGRACLPVQTSIAYEYGWSQPPDDLKRAMVRRLRSRLVADNSSVPERATSMTVEGSTFTLTTPGQRGAKTGIPDVDEIYSAYTREDWKRDFVGSMRIV